MRSDGEDIAQGPATSNLGVPFRWRALARAAVEAVGAAESERAVRVVLEGALEATGAERAFIVSARREEGRLEPVVLARASRREDGAEALSRTVGQRALAATRALVCPETGADPRLADAPSVRALRLRSVIAAPVRCSDGVVVALVLDSATASFVGEAGDDLLAAFAALAALARDPCRAAGAGGALPAESAETQALVGGSPTFRAALEHARRAATTTLPVLVEGESGTGKESLARAIHDASPRRAGPFVALNCAAIPDALIEAELFGVARGAFTGAERDRAGLMRAAQGGTLFLDEIGDMPLPMQAKLLRVLQDGRVRAVGAERETETDVRVVAATHRDLARLTAEGRFREDLYWRLAVVAVRLPPLRERPEDLSEIAAHLLRRLAQRHGLPCARLTAAALDRLQVHAWPGNVRELEAVLARALLAHGGGELPAAALVLAAALPEGAIRADARLEEEMIRDALRRGGGAVEAARLIGWSRQKLYRRMAALGIRPRDRRALNLQAESRAAATGRDPR